MNDTTVSVPAHADALAVLRSQSLASLVQRELEHRILAGKLRPGDKLNEEDIAGQLDVSRGPVREAFRALESAGLVRLEKNRGVFVREVSLAEADEIYEVRAGLDQLIGRLAAERIGPADVAELKDLLKKMQQAARARDVEAYYPLNVRFHDRLAELAGNRTLLATYRRLVNELHLYRRETLAHGPGSFPASTQEHLAIVEAVSKGDGEAASRLLYQHAVDSRERLHRALDRAPAHPPRAAAARRSKA